MEYLEIYVFQIAVCQFVWLWLLYAPMTARNSKQIAQPQSIKNKINDIVLSVLFIEQGKKKPTIKFYLESTENLWNSNAKY